MARGSVPRNVSMMLQSESIQAELQRWDLRALMPLQELIVHQILVAAGQYGPEAALEEPRSRLVVLPTGFGKTICFALPVPFLSGPTLVVYPLRSLLFDQERRFAAVGLEPVTLYGKQDRQERAQALRRIAAGGARLVISTLEVLLAPGTLQELSQIAWAHLVFDEAHVIQQWGSSFRPAYDRVEELLIGLQPAQCSAFTATADQTILRRLRALFGNSDFHEVRLSPDKPNIAHRVIPSGDPALSLEYLLRGQSLPRIQTPCIVFIRNRHLCLQLCRRLHLGLGQRVRFYHAGLEHGEKKHVEHWFRQYPDGILVATNAFGLGVDHPGIRTVLHWNLPDSLPAYVQEAGRAGRDGKPARAWVIQDRRLQPEAPPLQALLDSSRCRKQSILAAFGHDAGPCGSCDVCLKDIWVRPPEESLLLDHIQAHPGLYSAADLFHQFSRSLGLRNQNQFLGLVNRMIAQNDLRYSQSPLSWKRLTCAARPARLVRRSKVQIPNHSD